MNRLSLERSAYLKHASHQKVDWQPWSDEVFEQARREEKPVFLSTGAVWCHWCHVMAQESFDDEETAALLNEHCICVKLDRDERPDIDRRYQQAVAAMGGGNGWPLSAFLTPDKRAFFGGTYFPPEDRHGRPGLKNIIKAVHTFYQTKRGEVAAYAEKVMATLKPDEYAPAALQAGQVETAGAAMLDAADPVHGGFGTAPKFPMPGALEFLLRRPRSGECQAAGEAARRMLEAMAAGGFHDQLGGGFHRYSVDGAWAVPHFEKMADDNAGLLRNYVDGYAVFGDERFKDAALGIISFVREVLHAPDGGFYASQDADVTPDDEGGYFTWSEQDLLRELSPDEYSVLSLHLLHEQGRMHHDPAKYVLARVRTAAEIALRLGRDAGAIERILAEGKAKLLSARRKRITPFIDTAQYTSLNGMLISALFHAADVLDDQPVRALALTSLERILQLRYAGGRLMHGEGIPATLDDYIHLADALVAAYTSTGNRGHLEQADNLMQACMAGFYDRQNGGLFDTETEVLGTRLKRIEDVPHPSPNALGIMLLLKLGYLLDKGEYRNAAEQTLSLFSEAAGRMSVHAGAFSCALDAWFRMSVLTVESPPEGELARTARAMTAHRHLAIIYGDDRGRAVLCNGNVCLEPFLEPAALEQACKQGSVYSLCQPLPEPRTLNFES